MNRKLESLDGSRFDLVVIGGGIFGAFAAWDAAQRGLSVAIIERSDFGAATSANSYKLVHGGIRYVQHGDVYRVRQSSAERRAFLRIAPHLVQPLPIVVPTYGHGMKGRLALRSGMGIYDALTADRNRGVSDPERRIPSGRMVSRKETIDLFPGLESQGLTGSAIFSDAQMYNPPRLVLSVVKSAVSAGAVAANYVEATGLICEGSRVVGVQASDVLSGSPFEILAGVVLNAAGPYSESFLQRALDLPLSQPGTYSRDACFVVPRKWLHPSYAVAVQGQTSDPDAIVSRGARHLFAAPWRNYSLIGTWHKVYRGDPDHIRVSDEELEAFVAEINAGYSGLDLAADEVSVVNRGLVPFGENQDGSANLRYGHRSRLIDHRKDNGISNLISLIGVRFTTGRWEAQRAIDLVFKKLGSRPPKARTSDTPLVGGDLGSWAEFRQAMEAQYSHVASSEVLDSLAHNYGTTAPGVLTSIVDDHDLKPLGSSTTIGAQVRFAVREEMAMTLADVALRRTDMATGEYPGRSALKRTVSIIAEELGLSPANMERQIAEVEGRFPQRQIMRTEG